MVAASRHTADGEAVDALDFDGAVESMAATLVTARAVHDYHRREGLLCSAIYIAACARRRPHVWVSIEFRSSRL